MRKKDFGAVSEITLRRQQALIDLHSQAWQWSQRHSLLPYASLEFRVQRLVQEDVQLQEVRRFWSLGYGYASAAPH